MHAVAPIFGHIFFQMYFFPIIQYAYLQSEKFQIGQNTENFSKCFFLKTSFHTPFMNNGNILQVRKVLNRAEYWKIFQVFFF